jgi:hypothetical protein
MPFVTDEQFTMLQHEAQLVQNDKTTIAQMSQHAQQQQKDYVQQVDAKGAKIAEQGIQLYGKPRWEGALDNIRAHASNGDLTQFTEFISGHDDPVSLVLELGENEDRLKEFANAGSTRQHAIGASLSRNRTSYGYGNGLGGRRPAWQGEQDWTNLPSTPEGAKLAGKMLQRHIDERAAFKRARGW